MTTTRLTVIALVALSVSKLEAALAADTYTPEELAEALALEQARDEPRKTAVEALEAAIEGPAPAPVKAEPEGLRVPKGKSMLTKAGIKAGGAIITANMVTGGEDQLKLLKAKGLLV